MRPTELARGGRCYRSGMAEKDMIAAVQAALDDQGVDDTIREVGQFMPRGTTGSMFAGGMIGGDVGGAFGEVGDAIGTAAGALGGLAANAESPRHAHADARRCVRLRDLRLQDERGRPPQGATRAGVPRPAQRCRRPRARSRERPRARADRQGDGIEGRARGQPAPGDALARPHQVPRGRRCDRSGRRAFRRRRLAAGTSHPLITTCCSATFCRSSTQLIPNFACVRNQ